MVDFNEEWSLKYLLFDGDFGDPGDKKLKDEIVTARKFYECGECLSEITKGMRHRVHIGIYDGSLRTYRFCDACCKAMAQTMIDGDWSFMDERNNVREINLENRVIKRMEDNND